MIYEPGWGSKWNNKLNMLSQSVSERKSLQKNIICIYMEDFLSSFLCAGVAFTVDAAAPAVVSVILL